MMEEGQSSGERRLRMSVASPSRDGSVALAGGKSGVPAPPLTHRRAECCWDDSESMVKLHSSLSTRPLLGVVVFRYARRHCVHASRSPHLCLSKECLVCTVRMRLLCFPRMIGRTKIQRVSSGQVQLDRRRRQSGSHALRVAISPRRPVASHPSRSPV